MDDASCNTRAYVYFVKIYPPKIAGIGLRDWLRYLCGHFYLGISCLGAGCILCPGEVGARHQDGIFSSDLPFFKS